MSLDVRKALTDPAKAALFAQHLADGYLTPAFGARSKSEVDLLVFDALVKSGAVDPEGPIYDLARGFNITPTRARTLVLNWQLRSTAGEADLRAALIRALARTRFAKDGTLLTFGVENPLLREDIVARLKVIGVFADGTFSRDLVRLPVDAFVDFLDGMVDEKTKQDFKARLVKDKQLADKSLKALAAGVIGKLAEKVAGEAGDELAKDVVGGVADQVIKPAAERLGALLSRLLVGDAAGAAESVMAEK